MWKIALVVVWTLLLAMLMATGGLLPLLDGIVLAAALIGLVGGVAWFGAGVWLLIRTGRTTGTVVGYEVDEGNYFPRVEVSDFNGAAFQFVSRSGRGVREYKTGQRVSVALDVDSPEDSEIASVLRILLVPSAVIVVSLVVVVCEAAQR